MHVAAQAWVSKFFATAAYDFSYLLRDCLHMYHGLIVAHVRFLSESCDHSQTDNTEAESPGPKAGPKTKPRTSKRAKAQDTEDDEDCDTTGAGATNSKGNKKTRTTITDGSFITGPKGTNVQVQLQQTAQTHADATKYAADTTARAVREEGAENRNLLLQMQKERLELQMQLVQEVRGFKALFQEFMTMSVSQQTQHAAGGSGMHATTLYTPAHAHGPNVYASANPSPIPMGVHQQHAIHSMHTMPYPAATQQPTGMPLNMAMKHSMNNNESPSNGSQGAV